MNDAAFDYERGHSLLQQLVRGDGVIGLVADRGQMESEILESLWSAASKGSAPAFRALGDVYLAVFRTIGAFEGIEDEKAAERPWSDAARKVEDENEQLQWGLRALYESARLGDVQALMTFARFSRNSTHDTQRIALEALKNSANLTSDGLYLLGNVQLWLGEKEASAQTQIRAAELGNLDAVFELSLYYGQGLGVEADAAKSQEWLQKAADAGHPRALYNIGAALCSGGDFEKGATLYERAAEAGHGRAASTLAVMMLTGVIPGGDGKAVEWLDRADEAGFPTWEMLEASGIEDPREA